MKTKNKIEVSVIIPNYNYGHYIKQCINSVLESEFHHDALEIIIVDDASTDNSINIIEDIQNDTKAKIHLVKQSNNLGLAKSRNAGIKNASGNYLFFLDSDNYIGKSCLKTHYDFLSKNDGYTACYAPIQKFDDRSARMLNVFSNLEYDYDKLLYGNYIDAMSMIKKEDLIKLGSYDEEMPYSGWEDYELWLRMGSRNKKIYFIDGNPLSYYRIHENSMIRGLQSDKIGALASYVSEKYTVSTMQKNNNTRHTKIQIFWAGAGGVFFEEQSLFQYVHLLDTSKTLKFELGSFSEEIEFIRFDLGDEVGLININSIAIKDDLQNVKWSWDKCTLHAQQNLILVENKKLWPDSILQISRSIDPAFIITVNDAVKELSPSGFLIEITLSSPDPHQLNFLNTHTKPLSCFGENEFAILEQQVSNLNIEKNTLLFELAIQTKTSQNLERENLLLSENNKMFQEFGKQLNEDKISLNNDKHLLNTELSLKNEVIIKATNKIEELEKELIEKTEKEVAQSNARKIVAEEYNEKFQAQEKLYQQIKDEHAAQMKLMEEAVEKISLSEAEQKRNVLFYHEKYQSGEVLTASLQSKIEIEQNKVAELNNQIVVNQGKINELQSSCDMKEESNRALVNENIKIEKKLSTLTDSLNENLNQKNELIRSVNLHLSFIERLNEEKKDITEKNTIQLAQISSIKVDKQQLEMALSELNKKNRENELMINKLEEDILVLKNQKIMTFIKGKINSKKQN